ncbi:uncharacterized protein LOC130558667 isoform X2 [Triplophysa rosa]|uniref:uncharacterized protein LOC130558667 isoform X2 n=1 Tax=Triplophysa rosa TaxID=992332 RepID=UPI002546280C|nr:uncharacterized protein LOC130558667 isoform X2 [Triplophysa rosa]
MPQHMHQPRTLLRFLSTKDKVVVGSYMGMLRIFLPHSAKPDEFMDSDSQLLEVQLSDPIIQVEMGKFVSAYASDELLYDLGDHSFCWNLRRGQRTVPSCSDSPLGVSAVPEVFEQISFSKRANFSSVACPAVVMGATHSSRRGTDTMPASSTLGQTLWIRPARTAGGDDSDVASQVAVFPRDSATTSFAPRSVAAGLRPCCPLRQAARVIWGLL